MTYDIILEILEEEHQLNADVEEQVEIQTKYEGYINKSLQQVEKVKRMEEKKIPEAIKIIVRLIVWRLKREKNYQK
ncbi:hypothetical protein ACVPOS_03235 [Staphylococcus aureus]